VLDALCVAHPQGLVHRDIKPASVFLCTGAPRPGTVKVLDFGIAKAVHGDYSARTKLTETGQMLGTPQYMAPEQARGDPVSGATDLYALGLLIGEMLTGVPVVSGETDMDVLMAQVLPEPHQLASVIVASPLGAIVERAVRKQPAARYESAAQMRGALRQALPSVAGPKIVLGASAAPAVPSVYPPSMPPPGMVAAVPLGPMIGVVRPQRSVRLRLAVAVGIGLAVMALGAAAAWLVVSSVASPARPKLAAASASAARSTSAFSTGSPRPIAAAAASSAAPGELLEALEAADAARVDPLSVLAQAKRAAQRLAPGAALGCISPMGTSAHLDHGLLNLGRGSGGALLTLSFVALPSPSARPGTDPGSHVEVRIADGMLKATLDQGTVGCTGPNGPAPEPICSVAKAWDAAVAAGLPPAAMASVSYGHTLVGGARSYVWTFRVAGHGDLTREIDARTCRLVGAAPSALKRAPSGKGSAQSGPLFSW
jgi:hypothetical protein